MRRAATSLLDEPSDSQRFAIALTTLMAGAIGGYYMNFYWDYPPVPTIALHMNPAHQQQTVNWAPRWVPVTIMAMLTMVLWRMFVARARGISMRAAVITLFVAFALRQVIEFMCLDYSTALHATQSLPPWQLVAMFPLVLLGALFGAGFLFLWGFPAELIATLVLACAAGIPTAAVGRVLCDWLK